MLMLLYFESILSRLTLNLFLLLLSLPLQQQCKNIERKEGGKTKFTGDA